MKNHKFFERLIANTNSSKVGRVVLRACYFVFKYQEMGEFKREIWKKSKNDNHRCDVNVEKTHDMILNDWHWSAYEITTALGNWEWRERYILHGNLKIRKLRAKWVLLWIDVDKKRENFFYWLGFFGMPTPFFCHHLPLGKYTNTKETLQWEYPHFYSNCWKILPILLMLQTFTFLKLEIKLPREKLPKDGCGWEPFGQVH